MSVFLRWGVFGILAVAGLIYAYNASKKLAERRPAAATAAVSAPEAAPASDTAESAPDSLPAECAAEILVAQRALQARRDGEPLDRLLRIPEIAWQEPAARRERLVQVATRWFETQPAPAQEALRDAVIAQCEPVVPAQPGTTTR